MNNYYTGSFRNKPNLGLLVIQKSQQVTLCYNHVFLINSKYLLAEFLDECSSVN